MPALYTRGLPKVGEQEVRDRYLARLKSLTPATVDEWMKAARLFVGRRRGLLVHLLVQYDPLFVGSELRAASAAELQKLHSIPTLALRYWGDFTNNRRRANYYSNGLELALSLMSVPALFTDGSFDQKLFETAIGVRGGRR